MKVLVGCEFSGAVRRAFRDRGHDAYSADYEPSEDGSEHHYRGDMLLFARARAPWDIIIAFPPCTHLASSGARWFKAKQFEQEDALEFVRLIWLLPSAKMCIENPVGVLSTKWRKPDQIIQPWMFGHGETKATCLWTRNLPKLIPTNVVSGREARIHKMPPGPNRAKDRSRTYEGVAVAMAEQWGSR